MQSPTKIRFTGTSPFQATLRARVAKALEEAGREPSGGFRLAFKCLTVFAFTAFCYAGLVFYARGPIEATLLALGLSQGIVMIGFCVMHDAGHGAMSKRRWVNAVFARSLDLIGGNQTLWQRKHNVLHHTYTNIECLDDDLESGGLLRMHPSQPWRRLHTYQLWYFMLLYSLLAIHWVVSDFSEYFGRRVGRHVLPEPPPGDTLIFWAGKLIWFGLAIVLPALYHPLWLVVLVLLGTYMVVGLCMGVVFQMAHVLEPAAFVVPEADGTVADAWAIHQVQTTVNFATANPLVTWYAGGLNHQVEHHLFTKVSHVHYGFIRPIVKATCEELGVQYHEHRTVREAFGAHVQHLSRMAQEPKDPAAIPT